jgi:hypothetical protein
MTTNRLATRATTAKRDNGLPERERELMACEFAAIARETGQLDKAKLWDKAAAELGEERIPNGITVRFQKDGSLKRVEFRP